VSRLDDMFDYVFRSSMQSEEGAETKDKSMVVGSYIGMEIPVILLVMSLFSIVNLGLGIALLGMAILAIMVVNNLPAGSKVRAESSDDFESMAFYVMVGLFILTILIAWAWSG